MPKNSWRDTVADVGVLLTTGFYAWWLDKNKHRIEPRATHLEVVAGVAMLAVWFSVRLRALNTWLEVIIAGVRTCVLGGLPIMLWYEARQREEARLIARENQQ